MRGSVAEGAGHMDVLGRQGDHRSSLEGECKQGGRGCWVPDEGSPLRELGQPIGFNENHIPDGAVPGNVITIASTAYLVVPKDVSCSTAFKAGVIVERDTQPLHKRTPALSVLEVETQSGRRRYVQPISCM